MRLCCGVGKYSRGMGPVTDRPESHAIGEMPGPRVWALLGRRHGDNTQVEALAADLGLPMQAFRLGYNVLRELPNSVLGESLASVKGTPPFAPPWPDLVIGVGRRSVAVARWIRARSGGRTRLVHLGRPRLDPRYFDLVITTPQYGQPRAQNVVKMNLPYQTPIGATLASAPLGPDAPVLVVLGGDSWTLKMDGATVDALAGAAHRIATETGRPLVATTSPRTPPWLGARLGQLLGPEVPLYDWAREKGVGNPYRAYLAAAAWIVLTGDSVSSLADAVWTGLPVSVVPVPEQPWLRAMRRFGGRAARCWLRRGGNLGIGAPPPDMDALYGNLIASGMARRSGAGLYEIASGRASLEAERRAVIARVRALVEGA